MDTVARMAASGDYVALPDEEHYRIYFDQIRGVCETLQNWAESSMGKASPEGTCVRMFSDQILQSIELLRLKYLVDKRDSLKLDLNESGFPHFNEISKLENDAKNAGERLQSIPLHVMATEDALDRLFESHTVPKKELRQLGRRAYLDALADSEFMGAFSFAGIKLFGKTKEHRRYICSWACYNVEDNLIYLHLLQFDQDTRMSPLVEGEEAYEKLMKLLRRQGRRVSPLVVLATELDNAFFSLHPKVLRRMRVGPVLSSRFSFDECEMAKFLRREGHPNDVVFSLESEVIVSSHQEVKEKGWLFLPDTFRQIFKISNEDMECFDRKLSDLHRYLFMPHRLWQNTFAQDDPVWMREFKDAERIAFDEEGKVYEI